LGGAAVVDMSMTISSRTGLTLVQCCSLGEFLGLVEQALAMNLASLALQAEDISHHAVDLGLRKLQVRHPLVRGL
jgi:hypothetical protein